MIKILLVDDHQLLLDSLNMLFKSMNNVEVVAKLNDSRDVPNFIANNKVDIVVSDIHMPHLNGIDLALQLRRTNPDLKILLLTMAEDAIHIREAIKVGVNGYIFKKTGKDELELAIKKITDGKKYYSEDVLYELAETAGDDLNEARPETIEHLTSREIEILKLIAQEKSTSEIANALFISISTVETHRAHLMRKLNVKSAIGMVKFAIKHQLI